MTFDEFAEIVKCAVVASAHDSGLKFNFVQDVWQWRRGVLVVTLGEQNGKALVSYVAPQTGLFGARSSGQDFATNADGAEQAATYIVAQLSSPNLYN